MLAAVICDAVLHVVHGICRHGLHDREVIRPGLLELDIAECGFLFVFCRCRGRGFGHGYAVLACLDLRQREFEAFTRPLAVPVRQCLRYLKRFLHGFRVVGVRYRQAVFAVVLHFRHDQRACLVVFHLHGHGLRRTVVCDAVLLSFNRIRRHSLCNCKGECPGLAELDRVEDRCRITLCGFLLQSRRHRYAVFLCVFGLQREFEAVVRPCAARQLLRHFKLLFNRFSFIRVRDRQRVRVIAGIHNACNGQFAVHLFNSNCHCLRRRVICHALNTAIAFSNVEQIRAFHCECDCVKGNRFIRPCRNLHRGLGHDYTGLFSLLAECKFEPVSVFPITPVQSLGYREDLFRN